jgi:hypothetical protein
MLSFFVQTLFALQGTTTKRTESYSSPLSGVCLPSPTFILIQAPQQDALFAAPPSLNNDINIDPSEDMLDWLQERLGLEDVQLMTLVKRFPEVHTLSIEEQLQPTLDWLQERIGGTNKELGAWVLRQPIILRLSVPEQLAPNIAWLQERLALDPEQLQRVLRYLMPVHGFNQLLGSPMEETLEPTLEWLEEKLNLDGADLTKLIQTSPAVLGVKLEILQERVAWLQTRLDIDDKTLRHKCLV